MNNNGSSSNADQIYQAVRYIHENNLLHGNVDVQSIRICGRSGTVVLGESMDAIPHAEII